MTVFVDDHLIYKIDERITDPGVNTAQDIPIGELAPGTHTIGFRLDPVTAVQSVTRISNIELGEVAMKPVAAPKIEQVETFRQGVLVFFRLFFTDPDGNAEGFGFRGVNGSGWAQESHPFSSPSYGIVQYNRGEARGSLAYPFNHLCGTTSAYESDVEAWIYDSTGLRSPSVTIHFACSAPSHEAFR